jgi:hypothetical protein
VRSLSLSEFTSEARGELVPPVLRQIRKAPHELSKPFIHVRKLNGEAPIIYPNNGAGRTADAQANVKGYRNRIAAANVWYLTEQTTTLGEVDQLWPDRLTRALE